MTDEQDRGVDRTLTRAGAAWRAAQPDAPEPDVERFAGQRSTRWAPMLVAAGVVVLTAGLAAVVVIGGGDTDGVPPAKPEAAGQVVTNGARVAATGTLLRAPGEPLKLCQTNPAIEIHPPPAPTCSAWAVEVDERAVPTSVRWQETDGVRHTPDRYTVTGTWRDGEIVRPTIEPAPAAPQSGASGPVTGPGQPAPTVDGEQRYPMSCPEPANGWRAERVDPKQAEAARNALNSEVSEHPERYSGMWLAYPEQGVEVTVVGTVGDPAEDRKRLGEDYPFNLCVMRVDHSASELGKTAERLATDDGRWQTEVWPDRARVVVRMLVLDSAARKRIGDDMDKVIVKPFVHRT